MSGHDDHTEFLRRFEAAELSPQEFSHTQHVRMAWLYLRGNPLPEALVKIRDGIQNFARAHRADALYHETITMAYALILESRLAGWQGDWAEFQRANPDLLRGGLALLHEYYVPETLESERAKKRFIWPDRMRSES